MSVLSFPLYGGGRSVVGEIKLEFLFLGEEENMLEVIKSSRISSSRKKCSEVRKKIYSKSRCAFRPCVSGPIQVQSLTEEEMDQMS